MICRVILSAAVFGLLGCVGSRQGVKPPTPESKSSFIPDERLRAVVRDSLGKRDGKPISVADMARLTHLTAQRDSIVYLNGLEHAKNLMSLNLDDNDIIDLSPLSGLTNVKRLRLEGNRISDIEPLSELKNLERR